MIASLTPQLPYFRGRRWFVNQAVRPCGTESEQQDGSLLQGLVGLVDAAVAGREAFLRRGAREGAVVVPRVPQALVLHQVAGDDLHIVHDASQSRRHRRGIVEGAERVALDVEPAVAQESSNLVGKTGTKADNTCGIVDGEWQRGDADPGVVFYFFHGLF